MLASRESEVERLTIAQQELMYRVPVQNGTTRPFLRKVLCFHPRQ